MVWLSKYRWFVVGGVVLLVVIVVAVLVWWPSSEPEPRAREYRDFDVCLLTPARGLADPQVAAVWAGAQDVF